MNITIKYIFLFIFSSAPIFHSAGQSVLSPTVFFDLIKKNHPIVKQAQLISQKAENYVMKAKGSFDPKLNSGLNNKFYDGKNYMAIQENKLSIHTRSPIEINSGYDLNTGAFINPENSTPESGLLYAGVKLNLGRGLFTDVHRTTLKRAQLFKEFNQVEQDILVNNILLEASYYYFEWVKSFELLKIHLTSVQVAEDRFMNIKSTFVLGDRPSIDTLEALIQLNNRRINVQTAETEFRNATLMLNNYLWNDELQPELDLNKWTPPSIELYVDSYSLNQDLITPKIDSLNFNNPELKFYDYKLQDVRLETKLSRENIKPEFNINYNFLSTPSEFNVSTNNYKWGFGFAFPLLIRKERAELNLNKIKTEELKYGYSQKGQELRSKVYASLNNYLVDQLNYNAYKKIAEDYLRLTEAERTNFANGESSLFLVNNRELQYFDAQIKQIEFNTKLYKNYYEVFFYLGTINKL